MSKVSERLIDVYSALLTKTDVQKLNHHQVRRKLMVTYISI